MHTATFDSIEVVMSQSRSRSSAEKLQVIHSGTINHHTGNHPYQQYRGTSSELYDLTPPLSPAPSSHTSQTSDVNSLDFTQDSSPLSMTQDNDDEYNDNEHIVLEETKSEQEKTDGDHDDDPLVGLGFLECGAEMPSLHMITLDLDFFQQDPPKANTPPRPHWSGFTY